MSKAIGIHPSPNASTRSITFGPFPPTSTGGYGCCTGFGHEYKRREVDVAAVVLGDLRGPDRLHREHALAEQRAACRGIGAVVGDLLGLPACADPELEPTMTQRVDARDFLREGDRVALDDEADRGAERDARGGRGRRAEREERVERPVVVPGEAAGLRREGDSRACGCARRGTAHRTRAPRPPDRARAARWHPRLRTWPRRPASRDVTARARPCDCESRDVEVACCTTPGSSDPPCSDPTGEP